MNKSVCYIAALVALGVGWMVGPRDAHHEGPSKGDTLPMVEVGAEPSRGLKLSSEHDRNYRTETETDWPRLFASEQLEPLIKALREAGFSHESMESYLKARLNEEMGLIDLIYPSHERWWEFQSVSGQRMLQLNEVNQAINQQVANLLGTKPENEGDARLREYRFGDIPIEKTKQIEALLTRRRLEQMRRQEKDDGVSFAESYLDFHDSLRELLTASEYRAYLVRNGGEASSLKQQLQFLDVTEEQFESVAWRLEMVQLAAQKLMTRLPKDSYQRRVNQYNASREIREILGDEFYFEYSRRDAGVVQPYSYDGIVPPATILAAEEIKFRRYDELNTIHKNHDPSDPLLRELRAQVDDRHYTQVKMLMSPEEFRAYRDSYDGRWIPRKFDPSGG